MSIGKFFLVISTLLSFTVVAKPPANAPAKMVTDVYHGVVVEDPYRYMEQTEDPAVSEWLNAQKTYTRTTLDALPGLPALRARIEVLDAQNGDIVRSVQRIAMGDTYFLKKRPGEQLPKLYVRNKAGNEHILFDPDTLTAKTGTPHAIANYSVAPDGRHVTLVITAADAEYGAMRVLDTRTNEFVGTPIESIWGELPATWLPDSQSFVFQKLTAEGAFGKAQLILRKVGSNGHDDKPFMGWGVDGSVKTREQDWLFPVFNKNSSYALVFAAEGVNGLVRGYVAPIKQIGNKTTPWKEILNEGSKVRDITLSGQWLYMRTFDAASRYRVLRVDLSKPKLPPVEVVSQQTGVIEDIEAGKDALYYIVRNVSVSEVFALPHGSAHATPIQIQLPEKGSITFANVNPDLNGALFTLEPWTFPLQLYQANLSAPKAKNTDLIKPAGEPFTEVEVIEAQCTSHDGVKVPVSILLKKSLARGGKNPTFLYGYGGYGHTITAYYSAPLLAWLERGGVMALVNPRGSGAYGEDWYQAGVGATKSNTWKDMIACGQMLVSEGYTSPQKLSVRGGSMGGVAAGRALTERPDLFATAILEVGMVDTVRGIVASKNGPNHRLEMGDVDTEQGARQLLAMSSYHHVKEGEKYPAVMLTTGVNDNRVEPWQSFKMAARLQAASMSGKPILLRIEDQGGHGVNSTTAQRNSIRADIYAFHLWQSGDPDFQPK